MAKKQKEIKADLTQEVEQEAQEASLKDQSIDMPVVKLGAMTLEEMVFEKNTREIHMAYQSYLKSFSEFKKWADEIERLFKAE